MAPTNIFGAKKLVSTANISAGAKNMNLPALQVQDLRPQFRNLPVAANNICQIMLKNDLFRPRISLLSMTLQQL